MTSQPPVAFVVVHERVLHRGVQGGSFVGQHPQLPVDFFDGAGEIGARVVVLVVHAAVETIVAVVAADTLLATAAL